ncbi:MAG TPA: type III-B CRISPR module-associated protein Cmr3 [Caldisericia bacterium]|nr:type III-B CRISPR module-associated protein Cmr3 [Caldisericia bacterium]
MLKFTITPYDVLFFGSGKPFNRGGTAKSIFPPAPNSIASAIFAKFFAEKGIAINDKQGIYKTVYGPFVEKAGKIYFPAPMDILKEKKKEEKSDIITAALKKENFNLINIKDTDLDEKISALLWTKGNNIQKDYEPFKGYISLEGLKNWYSNVEIKNEELILSKDIFDYESRVSIHIENDKKTVKEEDGLYTVNFIRLKTDVKLVFWIEANYGENSLLANNKIESDDDLMKIFTQPPFVLKIGGETRSAGYEVEKDNFFNLFKDFKRNPSSSFNKVVFLTPGVFEDLNSDRNRILDCFGNKVINGAIGEYTLIGISSKNYNHLRDKTVRAIRPGSVLYFEKESEIHKEKSVPIGFLSESRTFIGSNLVLYK